MVQSFFQSKNTLTFKGKLFSLETPIVMGIINVTPDSFYRSSQYMLRRRIYKRAKQIIQQGASIIDIGACSTRPGSAEVSEKEELSRLAKAMGVIKKHFPDVIISVDTYRSTVAKRMVDDFGVNMINDISAGNLDPKMFETVAKLNIPYIAMHMQGTPKDMQINPSYENVIKDLFTFFSKKVEELSRMGVNDILIDPGFGFGKTLEHNYTILNNLDVFKIFNLPIVVGLSRKSMIYKPLAINPETALNGTTCLNTIALTKGAKILRVHDVKEAMETIMLTSLSTKQVIEL